MSGRVVANAHITHKAYRGHAKLILLPRYGSWHQRYTISVTRTSHPEACMPYPYALWLCATMHRNNEYQQCLHIYAVPDTRSLKLGSWLVVA